MCNADEGHEATNVRAAWAQNVMKLWVPTGRSNVAATRLYASTGATPLSSDDEVTYAYTRESFKPTVSE